MRIGNKEFDTAKHTYIMGILNVTPDSFSDGGKWNGYDAAMRHAEELLEGGTDILDIGGESTRPGHRQITSEEEITEYLEGAAAVCQIYSGYGIIKKKETYGCIWELEGANEDFSWSLQYLRKNNEEDTNENQTAIKNDNMCEGLISWRFAGDWSEEMQRIYEKKERLEKYSQSQSKLCLELIGSWPQLMTKEQIDESAKNMINKAGASLVSAKGQDNLQLYYGYGEKLGEVIRFQNERSNINLLYRVNGEKTICILGFPTVQWDD